MKKRKNGFVEFDFYKDDTCYKCKFATKKKDGTYGMFSRRYGCKCPERIDFIKRGDSAINAIKDGQFGTAISILHEIEADRICFERHGWIELYNETTYCPFKSEKTRKVKNNV
jgi:hypothetical protein